MWYLQAVIMFFIVSSFLTVLWFMGQLSYHSDIVCEPLSKKAKIITISVVYTIIYAISSFAMWGCHTDEIREYKNFLSIYDNAVKNCIEEETINYYVIDCNIAYQLERYDSTVKDYNNWVKYYKSQETDWFGKYSGIDVPDYIKLLNINSNCSCSNSDCE